MRRTKRIGWLAGRLKHKAQRHGSGMMDAIGFTILLVGFAICMFGAEVISQTVHFNRGFGIGIFGLLVMAVGVGIVNLGKWR